VLFDRREFFLDHVNFPWFKGAAVKDVLDLTSPRKGHLYWPTLDIDLHIDSLVVPESYPLVAKSPSGRYEKPRVGSKRKAG
jgi:hypothetical protein